MENGPWVELEVPCAKMWNVYDECAHHGRVTDSRRPKTILLVLYGYKDGTYRRVTTFDFGSTHSTLPFEEFLTGSPEFFTRIVVQVTSIFTDGSSIAVAIKNIRYLRHPRTRRVDASQRGVESDAESDRAAHRPTAGRRRYAEA